MKAMHKLMIMTAMMGGMGMGGYDDRTTIDRINNQEPTDAQRRMFKQPVKLSKKQKAIRKQNKAA